MIGGYGCLPGDAKILTPAGHIPLSRFQGGHVITPLGIRTAEKPVPVPSALVYVEGDGWQIRCNDAHLFGTTPTGDGFVSVPSLLLRLLAKTFCKHPLANATQNDRQNVLLSDILHWTQTLSDYLYSYFACCHLDDEQLRQVEEGDPSATPLLEYALRHIPEFSLEEDARISLLCIRLFGFVCKCNQLTSALISYLDSEDCPVLVPSLPEEYPLLSDVAYHICSNLHLDRLGLTGLFSNVIIEFDQIQNELLSQSSRLSPRSNNPSLSVQIGPDSTLYLSAYDTSFDTDIITETSTKTTVQNITYCGHGIVYTFEVDEAHCYYADGLLHHNCGKSFTDVIVLLTLIGEYQYVAEPINIGILGVTIKLLRRTVITDLLRYMDLCGLTYQHNSQAGYIQVGNVTLTYLQMQNPDDIYAFNFNCALIDELDELDAEKVPKVIKAIQERCRKMMPASQHFPRRSSFMFFSTTAQGLGGTYHLIKQFDKANNLAKSQGRPSPLPYAIIRAKTEDNPHNDPEQVKRLRALYTEEEAAAYLDGKFMNLANGRVWYSFDRTKHMCMRFPINPSEQIYVGQDFNLGINASCEMIVRGTTIYICHSHHWLDMGDAAIRLRQYYPTQPIDMIPDASGKEIMQGFVEEFEKAHIGFFWNNRNPSVTERVMAVNMLFRTGRLKVMQPEADEELHKDDIENVLMTLETHDIDEKTGAPRKGVGIKAPDHIGDSMSYGVWRIIHSIQGYDDILEAISHGRTKNDD